MANPRSVAIIGGGFSGALQAVNLLRHDGPRTILIERRREVGEGLAYSTTHPCHLLNVRAAGMSAFPDEPDHFIRWLARQGVCDKAGFVPRRLYGRYLAELVEDARRRFPGRLEFICGKAVGLDVAGKVDIHLADGGSVRADAAVLALGNLPSGTPDNLDPQALGSRYVADPWSEDLVRGLQPDDHILIIGTGLTMVDAVLTLADHGFNGRITAISRRGLLPREQTLAREQTLDGTQNRRLTTRPSGEVSALLRAVRARSCTVGWHEAVDELRPFTQAMWQAATTAQKQRFLRHLRPWWDVHRHRLARNTAQRIEALCGSGQLRIAAGKTLGFEPGDGGVQVVWRRRGATEAQRLWANRIVNCTGPQSDVAHAEDPLLADLLRKKLALPDAFGLGLSVDRLGRLLDSAGRSDGRLFALGPMTRGMFWEITAVPDIRVQTWSIARYLSNAYWVGGEGL